MVFRCVRLGVVLFLLFLGRAPPIAHAYTVSSPVTDPCHERITAAAWRAILMDPVIGALVRPTPASRQDRAVITDLPFEIAPDLEDIGSATLLVGVRDNDLKGRYGADAYALGSVHSDPDGQREHTLRRAEDDEPDGSRAAVDRARRFIFDSVMHAVDDGLDEAGVPDLDRRTYVDLHLALRGKARPALPLFHMYIGQALHTLQDSFTHAFRSPDGRRISVVVNWIEFAEEGRVERRDGPAHMTDLDRCADLDSFRAARLVMAEEASRALLRAALYPLPSRAQKAEALNQVLDAHMGFEPGCTFDNRWCDAPERAYSDVLGCGCRMGAPSTVPRGGHPLALAVAVAVLLRWRRRGGARGKGIAGRSLSSLLLIGALGSPATGWAAEPACVPGQQIHCGCPGGDVGVQRCRDDAGGYGPCGECTAPAESAPSAAPLARAAPAPPTIPPEAAALDAGEAIPSFLHGPTAQRFGVYMAVGAALDKTALDAVVAWRYRLNPRWLAGVGVEWNPWASLETRRFRAGVINVYASAIRRYHVSKWISVRTSLHLGASTLLFDLFGAPAGSVGPYVAFSWLGLEVDLGGRWRLIFDPMEMAVPIPHVSGLPLVYNQYRITIGFQWGT